MCVCARCLSAVGWMSLPRTCVSRVSSTPVPVHSGRSEHIKRLGAPTSQQECAWGLRGVYTLVVPVEDVCPSPGAVTMHIHVRSSVHCQRD